MTKYDFSTLGSSDLEELVCDLLNADKRYGNNVFFKTFKDGKDKGVDFLFSTSNNNYDIVGQVKHYYRTGYKGLFTDLKASELDKVKILSPNKYVLATSVDLLVSETEALKELFIPYIKSLQDILGKSDLNKLIQKHPNVVNSHFKLWLCDAQVFKRILNSNLQFRSLDFVENVIQKRVRLFVKTPLLDSAMKSLEDNNFIVITGEPGSGKTTLAETLCYNLIKDEYELLFIDDDINEAEHFLLNDESKQLIYFDDFLGSTKEEIRKSEGRINKLLNIVGRIKRAENKKLIFTTRLHIYNSMVEKSDKFKRLDIKASGIHIDLKSMNNDVKKNILLNHIDESNLQESYKGILRNNSVLSFVINHTFFNPRSIEFITSDRIISKIPVEEFESFIRKSFNDPSEIWEHSYLYQIDDNDRILLNTLFSFDGNIKIFDLRKAYDKRCELNSFDILNGFDTAIKKLNGSFLIIDKSNNVNLINPSLIDYLFKFLSKEINEVKKITNATSFISQDSDVMKKLRKNHKISFDEIFKTQLISNYTSFVASEDPDRDLIKLFLFIYEEIISGQKYVALSNIVNEISDWTSLNHNYELNKDFIKMLETTRNDNEIKILLEDKIEYIVNEAIAGEDDIETVISTLENFYSGYSIDFESYNNLKIIEHLSEIFSNYIFDECEWLLEFLTDSYEVKEKIDEINRYVERLSFIGIEFEPDLSYFEKDWDEIGRANDLRRLMEKDD